jgi:hypothetical protein
VRRSDDDLPEVDFVVSEARPAEDEELPQPTARAQRSRIARLRADLVVAVLVLGGGLVVARALSHGEGPKPPGSASLAPSTRSYGTGAPDSGSGLLNGMATISVTGRATAKALPVLPGTTYDDPARCPDGIDCSTVTSVPGPVFEALDAAFPGLTLESATTVRLDVKNYGRALWFLQANARVGTKQILLRLTMRRASDVDRYGVIRSGRTAVTYYGHSLLPYFVLVQVDQPIGREQPLAPLADLVRDVRLLARR